ncbi:catabolite control protein A, partial [Staphylococcus carnosus subsp. carnosus TM300]
HDRNDIRCCKRSPSINGNSFSRSKWQPKCKT